MRRPSNLWYLALGIVTLVAGISSQTSQPKSIVVPKYDLKTELRVKGVVADTDNHQCPISGGLGSHLVLKTQESTIAVHLAPTKFVQQYELNLKRGDNVEVIGTKILFEDKDAMLARQVIRGEETFVFRDASGNPAW